MAFFENLGKKISDVSQTTVQKTKDLAEIGKLIYMISDAEKKINEAYLQIGKKYLEEFGENPGESYAEYVNTIKEATDCIAEYKKNIDNLKGVVKCPNCGSSVDANSAFCAACGSPLPKPEPVQSEAAFKFCTGCGAKIDIDTKFCPSCGKAVSNPEPVAEAEATIVEEQPVSENTVVEDQQTPEN